MSNEHNERNIEALRQRIYDFVIRVVNLVKELPSTLIGNRIGGQLLDAGTSVACTTGDEALLEKRSLSAWGYQDP